MKRSKERYNKKSILFGILILVVLLGVLIQFVDKPIEGRPITGEIKAPQEVLAILERSCYDCHSNKPDLNWYDKIAPISWAVKKDVQRAREVMNFSEWGNLSEADHKGMMWAILNMVKAGKMPLKRYQNVHPDSKVTASEVETIRKYVLSLSEDKPASITKVNTSTVAPQHWEKMETTIKNVPESPNGVMYTDEFKNWRVISMSTLYDNSMRVIYGNDIAVKAIEEENFHPWPDGAMVVKAVWEQRENQYGEVRPGNFQNVQFMVKDSKKFKSTEGWGFAKFSTQKLIPTGKTALFAEQSCIACHRQLVEKTGYLFNVPLKVNPKK